MTPEDIVEYAEGLSRIAASGGGPKALAAHLAHATGGGVLLEDERWRPLASAGSRGVPASARAVVEGGAPGTAVRVRAGSAPFGWLSLFGPSDDAVASLLLRLTAAAIGVELARDSRPPHDRRESFWDAALSRTFHDAAAMREEAVAHGIALAPSYVAIALESEPSDDGSAAPVSLRALAADLFRSGDADVGLAERGNTLFVFVPAARAVDASNAKTAATLLPKSLARRKPPLRVSGGVGSVETLANLQAGAAAAESALAIGRRVHGAGTVAAFEDLGAYALLYRGADVERLRAFAVETLAPLRAYDEKHQTELERTLKLYFQVGQNVKTAAEQLHVHRHTVFYRLRQIAEIASRSLDSPHDQLTLRLAIAIDELHQS